MELHDALGTFWLHGVADGSVVDGFVEAIVGEGVGDAGEGGLDELFVDRVVEALQFVRYPAERCVMFETWKYIRVR